MVRQRKTDIETPRKSKRGEIECVGLNSFQPSEWQNECLEVIKSHKITFIDSPAGTGKTSCALYYACKAYLEDVTRNIVIVRTPAEMGKDRIGFLPGEANTDDKLAPHFESTKTLIGEFIGVKKLEADEGKRIHFTIPNFALGKTHTNVIYIIDEAQLLEPLILKLLLERIGEGTKTIVLGSSGQLYADNGHGRNALRDAKKRFFDEQGQKKYEQIGCYKFPLEACMRDDVVMDVIEAYDNED